MSFCPSNGRGAHRLTILRCYRPDYVESDLDDRCIRRAAAHAFYAVVPPGFGDVVLAGAEHLVIGGFQVEPELAGTRRGLLETIGIGSILAHGFDAVRATILLVVALARQDDLSITGLQPETVLAGLVDIDLKFSCHFPLSG